MTCEELGKCSLNELIIEIDKGPTQNRLAVREFSLRYQTYSFYAARKVLANAKVPRHRVVPVAQEISSNVILLTLNGGFPRQLGEFVSESQLKSWIYKVSVNQARNNIRDVQRKNMEVISDIIEDVYGETPILEFEKEENRLEKEKVNQKIWMLFKTLSSDDQAILIKEFGGKSLNDRDLARLLHVEYDFVRKRRIQIRKKLKRMINELWSIGSIKK